MVIVSLISIIVQTNNLHCNHKESIWFFFLTKKLYGSLSIFSVFHKSSNLNFVILKKVLYHFIVAVIKLRVLVLFFFSLNQMFNEYSIFVFSDGFSGRFSQLKLHGKCQEFRKQSGNREAIGSYSLCTAIRPGSILTDCDNISRRLRQTQILSVNALQKDCMRV